MTPCKQIVYLHTSYLSKCGPQNRQAELHLALPAEQDPSMQALSVTTNTCLMTVLSCRGGAARLPGGSHREQERWRDGHNEGHPLRAPAAPAAGAGTALQALLPPFSALTYSGSYPGQPADTMSALLNCSPPPLQQALQLTMSSPPQRPRCRHVRSCLRLQKIIHACMGGTRLSIEESLCRSPR